MFYIMQQRFDEFIYLKFYDVDKIIDNAGNKVSLNSDITSC